MSDKNILVFNVGNSSIKYSLFENSKEMNCGCEERLKSKEDYKKALEKINRAYKENDILVVSVNEKIAGFIIA